MSNRSEHADHTQKSMQPAGKYYAGAFNGQEGAPEVHALMSILSASFVTCSDGVGSANVSLLSRLYRTDGVLLKPSRPVAAIDAQLLQSVFGQDGGGSAGAQGQLYATHSTISGHRWSFVAGVMMAADFSLLPAHIALPKNVSKWLAYEYDWGPSATTADVNNLRVQEFSATRNPPGTYPPSGPLNFTVRMHFLNPELRCMLFADYAADLAGCLSTGQLHDTSLGAVPDHRAHFPERHCAAWREHT